MQEEQYYQDQDQYQQGYNDPQYQYDPYQQPQQGQYPQQFQPSQPGYDFGFNQYLGNDAVTGVAAQVGGRVFNDSLNNVQGKIGLYMGFLKYYFDVDTKYVGKKLGLVLFPLTNSSWKRKIITDDSGTECYASARGDVNAPDLYIPTMSFVTLVLLVGFSMGVVSNFHPEVLGSTASRALACVLFEAAIMKIVFHLIVPVAPAFLDILSYCGYIFVSVIVNLLFGMLFGTLFYHVSTIITSLMMGIYLIRTLRAFISTASSSEIQKIFILVIIVVQVFIAWFLGALADWRSPVNSSILPTISHLQVDEIVEATLEG